MSPYRGKTGKELTTALEAFSEKTGIRRIRIQQPLSVIAIRRPDGTPYKAYKGDSNYCYQVFAALKNGRWFERVVSSFDMAAGRLPVLKDPLVMQLCVNDTIRLKIADNETAIFRVVSLTPGMLFLSRHQEGGNLRERDRDRTDPFKYLICSSSRLNKFDALQVVVDTLGQVWPMTYQHEGANR
jgi:CRISPR-associated endonuclease Csn1